MLACSSQVLVDSVSKLN